MFQWMNTLVTLSAIFILKSEAQDEHDFIRGTVLVKTPSGPIRGTTIELPESPFIDRFIVFDRFVGIPYAKPPLDERRFSPPVEAITRTEELNATYGNINRGCIGNREEDRPEHDTRDFFDREDCLTLTITVPKPDSKNWPVFVQFSGGLFSGGTINPIGLNGSVIDVFVNYRLNVQGFLNLGIPEAPGNVGLMDQQMALKWIQKNIASFGGNPDDVTLYGQLAGGASAGFHMLSPGSRGLFHKAIIINGVPNSLWMFHQREDSIKSSISFAKYMGCTSEDKLKVLRCLRYIHPDNFLKWFPSDKYIDIIPPFGPTVDGKFLTDQPLLINDVNAADVMISNCARSFFASLDLQPPEPKGLTKEQFQEVIFRDYGRYSSDFRRDLVAIYVPNDAIYEDPFLLREAALDMFSDFYFHCPTQDFVNHIVDKMDKNVYRMINDNIKIDELMDAFRNSSITVVIDDAEKFKTSVLDKLNRFIKTGNVNIANLEVPEWPATTKEQQEYFRSVLNLRSEVKEGKEYVHVENIDSVETKPRANECSALKKLLEKYQ